MVPKTDADGKTDARRRLTERLLELDDLIDRQRPGSPERLALLREQANISDRREALVSDRL